MSAGYSGTPLIRKLGIKPGNRLLYVNAPSHYPDLLGPLPEEVRMAQPGGGESVDFIHLFAENGASLHRHLPLCKKRLDKNGMLWVSWIKKASKLETDIAEGDVRGLGLELGLVDVKICAVDADWSGLKFMYRKKDR